MSAPRDISGSSSFQPQEMQVVDLEQGQQGGSRIRKRDILKNAFTRGATVIGELGSRLDRSREGERRRNDIFPSPDSSSSPSESSSSSPPALSDSSPESELVLRPNRDGIDVKNVNCTEEDKNRVVSKIDELIALREKIVVAERQIVESQQTISQLKGTTTQLRQLGNKQSRRAICLGKAELVMTPEEKKTQDNREIKCLAGEEGVLEIRQRSAQLEGRINESAQEYQQTMSDLSSASEQYVSIVNELGDAFREDLMVATQLHHSNSPENVPHMVRTDSTLEALKSMKEAVTGGDKGSWASYFGCLEQFAADIWRSAMVIDGCLLSQSAGITTAFEKITAPGQQSNEGDKLENPLPPVRYHLEDALTHAQQADEHFQMPRENEISGNGRGVWTAQHVERFFDQQGVSLVERHRIYYAMQQGTMADYLNPAETKSGLEHYEKARTMPTPEERFAEYCRASLEVGGLGLAEPDASWSGDEEFMRVYKENWEDVIDFCAKEKMYTLRYELDLQSKTVHGYYLASYRDPLDKQKKVYCHHIEYDYARDKLVDVTTTEGTGGFRDPKTLNALKKFPLEQFPARIEDTETEYKF